MLDTFDCSIDIKRANVRSWVRLHGDNTNQKTLMRALAQGAKLFVWNELTKTHITFMAVAKMILANLPYTTHSYNRNLRASREAMQNR